MEILESLQQRVPEHGALQRVVIFGPENGASEVSAVLVRVPPNHRFPLHTHPVSEDCFFLLSGAGEAIEPAGSVPISAPAGVWVPVGHPHGLAAGPTGLLEVGFQSPPDPTVVPFDPGAGALASRGLLTESLSPHPEPGAAPAGWRPVFRARPHRRHLDPRYATLGASQRVIAEAREGELVVVVARGAVELSDTRRHLHALGALRLGAATIVEFRALESPTLLLAIGVRAA